MRGAGTALFVVDTVSFQVNEPPDPAAAPVGRLTGPVRTTGGGIPWMLVGAVAGGVLVCAGALAVGARRRRLTALQSRSA